MFPSSQYVCFLSFFSRAHTHIYIYRKVQKFSLSLVSSIVGHMYNWINIHIHIRNVNAWMLHILPYIYTLGPTILHIILCTMFYLKMGIVELLRPHGSSEEISSYIFNKRSSANCCRVVSRFVLFAIQNRFSDHGFWTDFPNMPFMICIFFHYCDWFDIPHVVCIFFRFGSQPKLNIPEISRYTIRRMKQLYTLYIVHAALSIPQYVPCTYTYWCSSYGFPLLCFCCADVAATINADAVQAFLEFSYLCDYFIRNIGSLRKIGKRKIPIDFTIPRFLMLKEFLWKARVHTFIYSFIHQWWFGLPYIIPNRWIKVWQILPTAICFIEFTWNTFNKNRQIHKNAIDHKINILFTYLLLSIRIVCFACVCEDA